MHTFLIAATSLDGFIAPKTTERSFDWTSAEDKQFYVSMIKKADAIVMGNRTFKTFSRYPKDSRWVIYSSTPESFINPKPNIIQAESTNESPQQLVQRLKSEGCKEVAICGGASIYSQFMEAGVVDTLFITVEPIIFGEGIKLFSDQVKASLSLVKVEQFESGGVVLEYGVRE